MNEVNTQPLIAVYYFNNEFYELNEFHADRGIIMSYNDVPSVLQTVWLV
jgi:hypothetical protein